MRKPEKTPNPGSFEARQLGCSCLGAENGWGWGVGESPSGHRHFLITPTCPVHAGHVAA